MNQFHKTTQFNIEEAIEVNYRLAELTGAIRRQYIFISTFFVVIGSLVFLSQQSGFSAKIITWLSISIIGFIIAIISVPWGVKKETRRIISKSYGDLSSITTETIINDFGISFTTSGITIAFEWCKLKQKSDNDKYIEIITEPLGIIRFYKHNYTVEELQEIMNIVSSKAINMSAPA